MALNRKHQTALFVDGKALQQSSKYRERSQRLEQSLNGQNIKVDIYTVFDTPAVSVPQSGIVEGLVLNPPAQPTSTSGSNDTDALVQLAEDAGYTQVLISIPLK